MALKFRRLQPPALATPLMWNGAASVIGQGATLLVTAYLSNWLGPANFARYVVTVNTTQTLSAVAQAGFGFTATNFVARYLQQQPGVASQIARFCLRAASLLGVIVGVVVAVTAGLIARHVYHDASVTPSLWAAAVAVPFAACNLVQINVAVGFQRFRLLAGAALVFAAALIGCAAVGVAAGAATGAAIGFVAAVVLRFSYTRMRLAKLVSSAGAGSRPAPVRDLLREIVPFALPAGLAGLTLTPAIWATNALLAARYGLHDLGLFAAAFTLKTLVAFVPMQVGIVFLPRYVSSWGGDGSGSQQRQLLVVVLAATGFSLVLAGGIALLAQPMMALFGVSFVASASILRWLMLSVVLECAATIWAYRLAAEMRMWTSLLAFTWPKDLLLVIMACVLVPRYGGQGLAVAHLISWTYAIGALTVISMRSAGASPARSALAA